MATKGDAPALTPEQIAQQKEDSAAGAAVSFRWMRKNPQYKNTNANADKFRLWFQEHAVPFSEENLDVAFEELKDQLEMGPNDPIIPPPKKEPFSDLTLADVKSMPLDDYKRNLKQETFRAALKKIGIGGI